MSYHVSSPLRLESSRITYGSRSRLEARTGIGTENQILKTRDDHAPVILSNPAAQVGFQETSAFTATNGSSWLAKGAQVGISHLRPRIEPWLTALFQSEHLSLLAGSGLSNAVHELATGKTLPWMVPTSFSKYDNELQAAAKLSAERAGRKAGNIEDTLRVANELLRGLEVAKQDPSSAAAIQTDIEGMLNRLATAVLDGERSLAVAKDDLREKAFNYLVNFLMSFASRTGTRDRLQIFTTNYDRFIEAGAEVAGLHLLDRFVGSLAPIFRSSRLDVDIHYNPPGIRGEPRYLEGVAKFTKLHGSLDWMNVGRSIVRMALPFGAGEVAPYLKAPGLSGAKTSELMIYPNSSKDRETAAYPYVELFRDFAAAVCRPNGTLVSYGYSFGDEHINRVIEDMLTIPSTHLVVISHGDSLGRIMRMYEKTGRPAQITLLIGSHLGKLSDLVDNYLPKPAIDRTTFRMSELLKSRWGTSRNETGQDVQDAATQVNE